MSENLLTLIPTDAQWSPPAERDAVIVGAVAEIVVSADDVVVERFHELVVLTPCCSRRRSLNDLMYDWPQGFPRWAVVVRARDAKGLRRLGQAPHLADGLVISVDHPRSGSRGSCGAWSAASSRAFVAPRTRVTPDRVLVAGPGDGEPEDL